MVKYYYAQNREDLLIKGFFPDVSAGIYVDVGANDPVLDSVTKLLYDAGWAGINIEPQMALFAALQAARTRDLNLNIGIGAEPGTLLFTEFPEGNGLSSFDRTVVDRLINVEHNLAARVAVERQVEIRTLATVIREAGLRRIHVMKIDVEGFEFEVLSGMDWGGVRPELICIEANKIAPERDWRTLLAGVGYTKVFHDGLNDYWLADESSYRRRIFDYPTAVFSDSPIYFPAAAALARELRVALAPELPATSTVDSRPLHLLIDAQVLQSEARYRGMGRYILSLIDALDVSAFHCTFLVNSELPPLDTQSRKILERQGTVVDLPLLHLRTGIGYLQAAETNRRVVTQAVAGATRARPARKAVFVIPALFCCDAYPVFPAEGTSNLLVFYDLIPYFFPGAYLGGDYARDYGERFSEFYRADHYACDSQSAADDLTVHLGVDPGRTTTVLGASAFPSGLVPNQPPFAENLGRFVLVASGNDQRKNNEATVRAFAQLGPEVTPVFTSPYPPEVREHLQSICPKALFAGQVSDPEMLWLTDNAEFVFFPSLYEGLGLPILEAVERGTPVVCSRIPSFTEISETAFRFFDPYSSESMTGALRDATAAARHHYDQGPNEYARILERFNWSACARRFIEAAEKTQAARRVGRLAMLAPAPSSASPIGKYALQTYAELSRHFEVDYFGEPGLRSHPSVRFNLLERSGRYFPASKFSERAQNYDHVLYHLGDSDFHVTAASSAFLRPGTAILHGTRLGGIIEHLVEVGMAPEELQIQVAAVDAALGLKRSEGLAWLATRQKLITTFSVCAEQAVDELPPGGFARLRLPQPVGVPSLPGGGGSGQGTDTCTVGFAGVPAGAGGLVRAVTDVASIPGVTVKIFGSELQQAEALLPRHESIRVLPSLSDLQSCRELQTMDIVVDCRCPNHGEVWRSTLEAMAIGAAMVVRRAGWVEDLPDGVVVKVDAEGEVAPAVRALVQDTARRTQIGATARAFLAESHGYADYAECLAAGIREASVSLEALAES